MEDLVSCPHCHKSFELSVAMRESLEKRLAGEVARIREAAMIAAREEAAAETEKAIEAKESELAAARLQLAGAAKKEAELLRRERELEAKTAETALELENKLTIETTRIRKELEAANDNRVAALVKEQLAAKNDELLRARAAVTAAAEKEAELLRQKRELDARENQIGVELERKLAEQTAKIRAAEEKTARERAAVQVAQETAAKDAELAEAHKQLAEASKKEIEIARREREVAAKEQSANLEVERRLGAETSKIRSEIERAERERAATQSKQLEAELTEARKKVAEANQKEADLLRGQRDLQAQKEQLGLELERKLNEEASKIRAKAEESARERLQIEQDKLESANQEHKTQLESLQRKLAEAQQKLSSAAPFFQGEAQEVLLHDILARTFPRDSVEDVRPGTAGTDVIQRISDDGGRSAGVVLWESKKTKTWTDEWLPKLRDDMRAAGADVAVLVTAALPPDVRVFGNKDGVWVVSWPAVAPVALMLRIGILEIAGARRANESRGEKMSLLYDYLTGTEFRNRFTGVVEAYQDMQQDLEDEKRAMLTAWKRRERQLKRAIENLASFYGDVQGIAGRQLADIEPLALPSSVSPPHPAELEAANEPEAARALTNQLVEVLYELIPADGNAIGNKSLSEAFANAVLLRFHITVHDEDYRSCKDTLLAQRRIRKGPGQGGSVLRQRPGGQSEDAS